MPATMVRAIDQVKMDAFMARALADMGGGLATVLIRIGEELGLYKTMAAAGALAADVRCGHGAATILMAKAYPNSQFRGYDPHPLAIECARRAAREADVTERVRFEIVSSKHYPGGQFDLVAFFDCLREMGDPAGAAAHVRQSLTRGGTWMIVEPCTQSGESRLHDGVKAGGFTRFRGVADTGFHQVFEARL